MSSPKWLFLAAALAGCLILLPAGAQVANKEIYPAPAQATPDLAAALKKAAATHKNVLLDFGGNWCGDCFVLDYYFHDPANQTLLQQNYILVHINIGRMDENLDITERYQIPVKKGVPALAVLDERGHLIFSQRTGEFEKMRSLESSAVTSFLLQWKPAHR